MFEILKSRYYHLKDWFRNCCNKQHFRTVWAAIKNRPWDYAETYDVLKHRLIETRAYFIKSDIIAKESIDKIVKELDLALSLYDIMSGEKSAGHWEYEWDDEFAPFNANETTNKPLNRLKYIPERYVNLRNSYRFTNNDVMKTYYKKCPNELYEEKARRLFWKVMAQYSQNWWD